MELPLEDDSSVHISMVKRVNVCLHGRMYVACAAAADILSQSAMYTVPVYNVSTSVHTCDSVY